MLAVDEAAGEAIGGSGLACRTIAVTGSACRCSYGIGGTSASRPTGVTAYGQQVRRNTAEAG